MNSGQLLRVDYLTPDELTESRARGWRDVLGIALFSVDETPLDAADVPLARVATRPLGGQPVLGEVWRAEGPFETGTVGLVHFRSNGQCVFGCVTLPEGTVGAADDGATLRSITKRAYAAVFDCLAALRLPHAVRIWNYLPRINRTAGGIERYLQFNEARQRAFRSSSRSIRGDVPAACALGSVAGNSLVVYFLATATAGMPIENPRQLAAYDYPPEYGAFSPTFSRATLAQAAGNPVLFVSGTASIVGHRTLHAGDVGAQARETAGNIRALVAEANRIAGEQLFAPERLGYKAYVRHPGDVESVVRELDQAIHPARPVVCLNADVCRADLLVEIEAVGFGRERREL